MAWPKQSSKRKRRKTALVLGAAGVSLTMAGGASATAPPTNVPSQDTEAGVFLAEEEISDVSLATFRVFDRENPPLHQGIRVAAGGHGCGCGGHGGGCGGCGGCRGCSGCAARGCAAPGVARGAMAPPGATRGTMAPLGATRGTMAPLSTTRGRTALGTVAPGWTHHHHGCRGCRACGCACGGVWIGGCWACSGDYTTCWQWDPVQGQWVYVCYY